MQCECEIRASRDADYEHVYFRLRIPPSNINLEDAQYVCHHLHHHRIELTETCKPNSVHFLEY